MYCPVRFDWSSHLPEKDSLTIYWGLFISLVLYKVRNFNHVLIVKISCFGVKDSSEIGIMELLPSGGFFKANFPHLPSYYRGNLAFRGIMVVLSGNY
jgi:hypothetical protein